MREYRQRNMLIERMGFKSYIDYLASSLWSQIRKQVFDKWPQCFVCGRPANQVHHGKYTTENLSGRSLEHLYAVCSGCHRWCEFKGNRKLNPKRATRRLHASKNRHAQRQKHQEKELFANEESSEMARRARFILKQRHHFKMKEKLEQLDQKRTIFSTEEEEYLDDLEPLMTMRL